MLTLPTSQRRAPRQNGEHVPGTLVSLRSVVGPGTGRGDPLGAEGRVSDLILPTGDERREDARRETVVDLVQRELDDLGAEHRRLARRAASLEWTNGILSATNSALTTRLRAIEQSTSWRITSPLRDFAQRFPRAVRVAGRTVPLLRSALMLQLSARLHEPRRELARGHEPGRDGKLPVPNGFVPERVALPDPSAPVVSVVIPSFGKVDYTLRCLASIAASPPKVAIEVIVIDDASQDFSVALLEGVRNLRLIVSDVNRGFLRSCNEAARHARGEYLLLLNNDTQVLPGWLDSLLDIFRSQADVGAVGSKLLYPDGRLQEAGGIIWEDASGVNFGRFDDPDKPIYDYVREVDYCSGASLLVRRDLFAELGGFDESYAPAYYEDTDLAFRLRERGLKVIYQPRSCIIHFEGVSHGTDLASGVKAYQVQNQIRFRERWQTTLETEHAKPWTTLMRARDRARDKPVLLVIDHMVPEPDRDAGSRNILNFVRALQQAGMVVKFWPQDQAYRPHYTPALQDMGVEVFYGSDPGMFRQWIGENGAELDYVLLSRPAVASHFLTDLKRSTDAKLIYYGQDLHFLRMRRQAEVLNDESILREAAEMERIERWVWRSADAVLHPSVEEAETVAEMEPLANSRAVVPFCFSRFGQTRPAIAGHRLLFVAGFAHPPNEDAAVWFAEAVLPEIQARVPRAHLDIVGSKPTPRVLGLAGRQITVTRDVSDAELEAFYRAARVAVVPLRFGAGMKLKVVEALKEGVPLVTTPVGAQGLPGLAEVAAVQSEAQAFADAVCRLLTDDAAWTRASAAQIAYAEARFSEEALRSSLLDGFRLPEPA